MDVKSDFLNGFIDEEIYIQQPEGLEVPGKEDWVLKLKKVLYGLKQAPRAWYSRIDSYLREKGYERSASDPDLYTKLDNEGGLLIIALYVDDLLYTGNSQTLLEEFRADMCREFEMTDLGQLHYFLGVEIWQSEEGILVTQSKYAKDLLKKFNMSDCKPLATPVEVGLKLEKNGESSAVDPTRYRQLVGSLIYLTLTRPDIAFAVGLVSRYMSDPGEQHWIAAKRILRYVKGTLAYGIQYRSTEDFRLFGYSDSDLGGCSEDKKSTSGYSFSLGSGTISWSSKKQPTVSLSTAEAEYKAVVAAGCEAVWLRRILQDLQEKQKGPTEILCDNQSTIQMTKNPVAHSRTKHIDIQHHFVRELVQQGDIQLTYCSTEDQVADIFTKGLAKIKFCKFREMLGVTPNVHYGGVCETNSH